MRVMYGLAAAAAGAAGAALLRSEYEKNQLVTERYVIKSPKIRGKGKTFVFLTDLHDKEFGKDNRRLISAIRRVRPDGVLVGGDTMVAKGKADLSVSLNLLGTLAREFPVICANGNHENRLQRETHHYGLKYMEYRRALKDAGAVYLADSFLEFGEEFSIYGLDLPAECYRPGNPKLPAQFVPKKLGQPPKDRFSILLAHSPLYFREYADWGADLTLAGHFHGGTIRLPVLGGVMTPQYQFFFPWCSGMVREQDHRMIVGRGLGTHSIRIRLNNKPQLVVVRIESETTF